MVIENDSIHNILLDNSSRDFRFDYIEISVNPEMKSFTIKGKNHYIFNKSDWELNKKLIEKAIVDSYMDPQHHYKSIPHNS